MERRHHHATGKRKGRPPGTRDSKPRKRRTPEEIAAESIRLAPVVTLQESCYSEVIEEVEASEATESGPTWSTVGNTMAERILSMAKHVSYLGDLCKLVKTVCSFGEFSPGPTFTELVDWVRSIDFLEGNWSYGEDADFSSEVLLLQEVAATETKRQKWLAEYDMAMREARIFRPIDIAILPDLWPCILEEGE